MLLCESDNEKILYTGDFPSNGRKSYDRLLSALPSEVDVLICEGTTLSREGYVAQTETELENEAVKLFAEYDGPIFILQSSMNIDRIVTMYRAAKRSSRIFLQDLYMANITSAVGGSIPNPNFTDVYTFITNPARYDELCLYGNRVGKEFISQSKFVMCVRTSMLRYLKSLANDISYKNGLLVYSYWSGYKEQPEMISFLFECQRLGLEVRTLHTSGHADQEAIHKLIETVKPKQILPVHTEFPEWFDMHTDTN